MVPLVARRRLGRSPRSRRTIMLILRTLTIPPWALLRCVRYPSSICVVDAHSLVVFRPAAAILSAATWRASNNVTPEVKCCKMVLKPLFRWLPHAFLLLCALLSPSYLLSIHAPSYTALCFYTELVLCLITINLAQYYPSYLIYSIHSSTDDNHRSLLKDGINEMIMVCRRIDGLLLSTSPCGA